MSAGVVAAVGATCRRRAAPRWPRRCETHACAAPARRREHNPTGITVAAGVTAIATRSATAARPGQRRLRASCPPEPRVDPQPVGRSTTRGFSPSASCPKTLPVTVKKRSWSYISTGPRLQRVAPSGFDPRKIRCSPSPEGDTSRRCAPRSRPSGRRRRACRPDHVVEVEPGVGAVGPEHEADAGACQRPTAATASSKSPTSPGQSSSPCARCAGPRAWSACVALQLGGHLARHHPVARRLQRLLPAVCLGDPARLARAQRKAQPHELVGLQRARAGAPSQVRSPSAPTCGPARSANWCRTYASHASELVRHELRSRNASSSPDVTSRYTVEYEVCRYSAASCRVMMRADAPPCVVWVFIGCPVRSCFQGFRFSPAVTNESANPPKVGAKSPEMGRLTPILGGHPRGAHTLERDGSQRFARMRRVQGVRRSELWICELF
jgi:hypothetical protein